MIEFSLNFSPAAKKLIEALPKNLEEATLKGLRLAMFFAEGASKKVFAESGPVKPKILTARSGHLRRSIKSKVDSVRKALIYSKVKYAAAHELGIPPMPKRPFLRPAFEGENLEKIKSIIVDSIVKEL